MGECKLKVLNCVDTSFYTVNYLWSLTPIMSLTYVNQGQLKLF